MDKKKKKRQNEDLRLVIMNEHTFEEKYSFKLNLKNLYILVSSVFILLIVLIFLFIALTPVKHLVPGYGNIENNSYVIKLNRYINELETQIETQEQYNKALRKILVGEDSTVYTNLNNSKKNTRYDENDKGNLKRMDDNLLLDGFKMDVPLIGKINKNFDVKTSHYGMDIAGAIGSPVKAVMDGTIIFSDWSTETGNTIIIQHPNGILSVYKHNSSLFKEIGDFVKKGEVIANLGNSGTLTSGPHLHFELWYNGIPLDPAKYLNLK
jgi:murein DD-endopeptidase MepM/ murein hydrolase activator NlpD